MLLGMRPVIALLSDFGTRDHYAGTMKGVMLSICPSIQRRVARDKHDSAAAPARSPIPNSSSAILNR